jgi:hypothetical protein
MDRRIELYFVADDGSAEYLSVPWWSVGAAIKGLEREGYRHVEEDQFLRAMTASHHPGVSEAAEEMLLGGR